MIGAPLSKYPRYPHPHLPADRADRRRSRARLHLRRRAIGFDYDVKNIFDLLRYLFPLPVPQRWRRRMMALGSGHPTRIICSALIAQAFEHVRYPILPKVTRLESETARRDILEIRHSSLYAPRDFDISPYFELVKPTIERGFDYRRMAWAHLPETLRAIPAVPDEAMPPTKRPRPNSCRLPRPRVAAANRHLPDRVCATYLCPVARRNRCSKLPSRR